jgi:hypothetical protein
MGVNDRVLDGLGSANGFTFIPSTSDTAFTWSKHMGPTTHLSPNGGASSLAVSWIASGVQRTYRVTIDLYQHDLRLCWDYNHTSYAVTTMISTRGGTCTDQAINGSMVSSRREEAAFHSRD